LVLYWTVQNVYQLVQQTVMLRNKGLQMPPPKAKPEKPKPKR
jgi:membrane protein insertase Oxa1/YidC/SpoIIIJ